MNTHLEVRWPLAGLGVLFVVCGVGCGGGDASEDGSSSDAVSTRDAVVLDENATNDAKVLEDRVELPALDAATRARLKVGSVVVGRRGKTADNAHGFLRRVRSVGTEDGRVVLSTSAASLKDVISSGSFEKRSGVVDPYATGGEAEGASLTQQTHGGGTTFTHTFDARTLLSEGGFEARLEPTKTTCSPFFETAFAIRGFRLDTLRFVMNDRLSISAEVSATARGRFAKSVAIPLFKNTIPLPPQQLGIIPLEETVDVSVDLACDFSAEGSISASAGIKVDLGYRFGIEYADHDWKVVAEADAPTFTPIGPTVHAAASSTIDCKIVPRVALLFYDVVGPYISVTPRLVATASGSLDKDGDVAASGKWSLTASLRADAGLTGQITVPGAPKLSSLLNDGVQKAQLELFSAEKRWSGGQ